MHTRPRWLLLASVIISAVLPGLAAQSALAQEARGSSKRVALVIGNSAYKNIGALINPANDATDMAQKLRSLKFDVLLATDATQAKMASLLREFKARVSREHVALIFYAGHGVTVNRESFLLPVDVPGVIDADANGELRPEVVNEQLVSMESVLAPLETSKIGIVFLDACRTNAAVPGYGLSLRVASLASGRSVQLLRGAGSVEIKSSAHSAGVFRAYATQLDNVASDGEGRNSPFTKALLKHIGTKGIAIQELMIRVRRSVMEETKNQQVPWEEAALNDGFSFVEAAATLPARLPAARPQAAPPSAPPARKPSSSPSIGGTGF